MIDTEIGTAGGGGVDLLLAALAPEEERGLPGG